MIVRMKASADSLARSFDVALLDLDGVVYVGEQPVRNAAESLAAARDAGMRLAFVTNNASRTPNQVAALLSGLGVPAEPADVITSSHAAAHYLADRLAPGAAVLVLGTTGLIEAVTERGLVPVFSADDAPQAVVQGYSPDLGWHALAEGMVAIRQGATWIATNLDPTVPSPRGPLPGNGSLVAALQHASGVTPIATGKPDPTMHAESVQRSGAKNPLVVGDRLDTDIEGARRVGCDALLVLSGVTTATDLLRAGELHRPDYLGHDVSALLLPQPAVEIHGTDVRCGAVVVRRLGSRLALDVAPTAQPLADAGTGAGTDAADGSADAGDGLDALRALAVASWAALDAGVAVSAISVADESTRKLLTGLGLQTAS